MNTRLRAQIALVACCCAAPLALAADKLDVKPGLWEITSSHHITGIPPMPKEWADKVTPEQRAAMEAAFRKESEKGPQTDTDRGWPNYSYVIISVQNGTVASAQSWMLNEEEKRFYEEPLVVDEGERQ